MKNALKALRKRELKRNNKLTPSSFLIRYKKEWAGTAFYVNRVFPHEVYVTRTDPFQHDIKDYDSY